MARNESQRKIDIVLPRNRRFLSQKFFIAISIFGISLFLIFYPYTTAILGTGGDIDTKKREIAVNTNDNLFENNSLLNQTPKIAEKNISFGIISLKSSSYIYDNLQNAANAPRDEGLTSSGQPPQNNFSIKEVWSNPFAFASKLAVTTKNTWVNDGRKSTLIKLIDSISRYYISYGKFPVLDKNSSELTYDWVTEMVDKNEMSGVYEYVLKTTAPVSYCGTSEQTGYCFQTDNKNAILYVRLEKFGDSVICEEGDVFFLWSSLDNKLGSVCLDELPVDMGGFEYFIY